MPCLMNSNSLGSTQNQDHSVFPFLWLTCYVKSMFSGFIYITSNKIFFVWSWIMLQCICTHIQIYFFLPSMVGGYLGWYHPTLIPTMSSDCRCLSEILISFPLAVYPDMGFLVNSRSVFSTAETFTIYSRARWYFNFYYHSVNWAPLLASLDHVLDLRTQPSRDDLVPEIRGRVGLGIFSISLFFHRSAWWHQTVDLQPGELMDEAQLGPI